jgi:hypothetical protein
MKRFRLVLLAALAIVALSILVMVIMLHVAPQNMQRAATAPLGSPLRRCPRTFDRGSVMVRAAAPDLSLVTP